MTNRELAEIVKDQKPLMLLADRSVREACRRMWEERNGSVLVIDGKQQLRGIFTGRDAVRLLANGKDANCPLVKAMTRNPVTITANNRAVMRCVAWRTAASAMSP
jgi:CBS domain-containing protein